MLIFKLQTFIFTAQIFFFAVLVSFLTVSKIWFSHKYNSTSLRSLASSVTLFGLNNISRSYYTFYLVIHINLFTPFILQCVFCVIGIPLRLLQSDTSSFLDVLNFFCLHKESRISCLQKNTSKLFKNPTHCRNCY